MPKYHYYYSRVRGKNPHLNINTLKRLKKRGCAAYLNKKWTNAEKEYIKANAHRLYDRELASRLSEMSGRRVTLDSVRKVRQKLGVKKSRGRGLCNLQKGMPDELQRSTYTNVVKGDKVADEGDAHRKGSGGE